MQVKLVTIETVEDEKAGMPLLFDRRDIDVDIKVPSYGFRRLESIGEGGLIVEVSATCEGGMVAVRFSEAELREMAKRIRADDIPPKMG